MKKKHIRVLKQIQDGIPDELLRNLTKTELQAPTIKKVFEKALEDPNTTPRQRRNIQAMLDSGKLDRTVEVLDHEVEKQIDAYYAEEIAKAVKLGRLPKEAPMDHLKNKGKQYARRQEKRLRTLFTGEASDVVDNSPEDQNHEEQHQKQQIADPSVSRAD